MCFSSTNAVSKKLQLFTKNESYLYKCEHDPKKLLSKKKKICFRISNRTLTANQAQNTKRLFWSINVSYTSNGVDGAIMNGNNNNINNNKTLGPNDDDDQYDVSNQRFAGSNWG